MNFKTYFKAILLLAFPMIIQGIFQALFGLIDQLMISRLGDDAIAAVGIANKFSFLTFFIIIGFSTGLGIFVAQYSVNNDQDDKIQQIFSISYFFSSILIIPYILISLFAPEVFFKIYDATPEQIYHGIRYQRIFAFFMIPMAINSLFVAELRSFKLTKAPLVASSAALIINTTLNYLLIHGHFGFPALGVQGAAIATVTSKIIDFVILLIFMLKYGKLKHIIPVNPFRDMTIFKKFMLSVLPAAGSSFAWAFGEFMYSYFYAKTPGNPMAALSLTQPMINIIWGVLIAFSVSFGVKLGNAQGEGDYEKTWNYAKWSFPIGWFFAIIFMFVIYFVGPLYLKLYSYSSPEVLRTSLHILYVMIFALLFKVSNMIINSAILRSGGKTFIPFLFNTLSVWLVGVPLAFLTVVVFEMDLVTAYAIVQLEEVFRMIIGMIIVKRKRWIQQL